jgi:hypothetical protein
MNPLYRPAVCLSTIGAILVAQSDQGRTTEPPSNVVTTLLSAGTSSTATWGGTMVANTSGADDAVYEVLLGPQFGFYGVGQRFRRWTP